jgi:hypothetical protein
MYETQGGEGILRDPPPRHDGGYWRQWWGRKGVDKNPENFQWTGKKSLYKKL